MALIKCPECRKEIDDKETKCPYCGFNIKELETHNKKYKLISVIKKVGLVAVILILVLIGIMVAGSHSKMKAFEGYVDQFVYDWDKMAEAYQKEPKDLVSIDVYESKLCYDMRDISKTYVELGNKAKAEEYLEEHTFKDMFEYVMELIEEDKSKYYIDEKFIDFYTNMKR